VVVLLIAGVVNNAPVPIAVPPVEEGNHVMLFAEEAIRTTVPASHRVAPVVTGADGIALMLACTDVLVLWHNPLFDSA